MDLTPYDIHRLDQAYPDAVADVDALADDPETTRRLAEYGPERYAAELTRDMANQAPNLMALASYAALATIRRVQERAELRAEIQRLRAAR